MPNRNQSMKFHRRPLHALDFAIGSWICPFCEHPNSELKCYKCEAVLNVEAVKLIKPKEKTNA